MKVSINLLPPKPEFFLIQKRKKNAILFSEFLVFIFLLLNAAIFGFFFWTNKNIKDTLDSIKNEEIKINSLKPVEKKYRDLSSKIFFLGNFWEEKGKSEKFLDFAQSLLVPNARVDKILFRQKDLSASFALTADNSDDLENFLNNLISKEKEGKIKELKMLSASRRKEGGYEFSFSFKYQDQETQ